MSDLSMCVEDLKHIFGDRVMVIDEHTDFSKLPNPFENLEHLIDPGTMKLDGYDDCVLGVIEGFNMDNVLCYDKGKIIERLMEDGMDLDEAHDYFGFNILGSYAGRTTPCFLMKE
jgi:hypothetical protein